MVAAGAEGAVLGAVAVVGAALGAAALEQAAIAIARAGKRRTMDRFMTE